MYVINGVSHCLFVAQYIDYKKMHDTKNLKILTIFICLGTNK